MGIFTQMHSVSFSESVLALLLVLDLDVFRFFFICISAMILTINDSGE